ncbi:winged helix-turn-helix transcriptional regulator [Pseudoteredinibacter isoporae]|uniref:DNA-binding HxlR family transcriptional regulator n=1 Tax=Pseudoteredinibacter isoporae TaxID=570281 RepID=A0A7X0JRM5_9GAMM|nr:helix-turn-helix domain-containing protein [Pseudoteredinibacter isoporae]MBB6521030.1 DNA-binding HxlR family transcriptional regulator [Pseudoteredinibacter isoporae]NHO86594.1 helix-turn-helix transcriptional regulator [Pseudoteredinibacter isoporae]NIB24954.1 helix-turn-helix transcriptional regulator [Pseudoteredinibacter isoporae]
MAKHTGSDVAPNVYAAICPSREVLALIGEKWVSLIVGALDQRVLRFGELKRLCEGISQKMLTQSLRKMERDGLIVREVFDDELVLRVEYSLSPLGQTLIPVVSMAKMWAEENLRIIEANRRVYDEQ